MGYDKPRQKKQARIVARSAVLSRIGFTVLELLSSLAKIEARLDYSARRCPLTAATGQNHIDLNTPSSLRRPRLWKNRVFRMSEFSIVNPEVLQVLLKVLVVTVPDCRIALENIAVNLVQRAVKHDLVLQLIAHLGVRDRLSIFIPGRL